MVLKKSRNFPRKGSRNFTPYFSERPEMTPAMGSREGQNNEKPNQPKEQKMKSLKFFKPALATTLQSVLRGWPAIRPARRSWLHCNPAASRARCCRDRKRSP